MRKVFMILLAVAGMAMLAAGGCTNAGDPVYPKDSGGGGGAFPVTVALGVVDGVGAWDNLHVDGELTGGSPVAMTADGLNWSASVQVDSAGTYGYSLYTDDGTKAMVMVSGPHAVAADAEGGISGDTGIELEGNATDGFRLVVYNNNPGLVDIKIKGLYDGWATVERDGMSADGTVVYRNVAGGLAAGDYDWGAIEDDGSEWGIWLIEGDNPSFTVGAGGQVTGTTTYTVASPTPAIDVTFAVDMNGETVSPNGVHLAGGFGGDGYVEWQPGSNECTDADEDGIYEVMLTLRQDIDYEFKFINGNGWPDAERFDAPCTVDDENGGFNRSWRTPTVSTVTYGVVWETCPATR